MGCGSTPAARRISNRRASRPGRDVRSYLITRVAVTLGMLIATSIIVFAVLRVIPGDPVVTRLGSTRGVSQETIDHLRHQLGLDRSIVSQYLTWVGGIPRGDLGKSYFNDYPVGTLIGQRIGATMELTILAVLLSIVIAVPTAVLSAVKPAGPFDRIVSVLSS